MFAASSSGGTRLDSINTTPYDPSRYSPPRRYPTDTPQRQPLGFDRLQREERSSSSSSSLEIVPSTTSGTTSLVTKHGLSEDQALSTFGSSVSLTSMHHITDGIHESCMIRCNISCVSLTYTCPRRCLICGTGFLSWERRPQSILLQQSSLVGVMVLSLATSASFVGWTSWVRWWDKYRAGATGCLSGHPFMIHLFMIHLFMIFLLFFYHTC